MRPIAETGELVNTCDTNNKLVSEPYINLDDYFSFGDEFDPLSPFYAINASIQDNSKTIQAYPGGVSKTIDLAWDIGFLSPGQYELTIEVMDIVRNTPFSNSSCTIEVADYGLDLDIADPTPRFRNFFDRSFAVVDDEYLPSFKQTLSVINGSVDYCIEKIDPEDEALPSTCSSDKISIWPNDQR